MLVLKKIRNMNFFDVWKNKVKFRKVFVDIEECKMFLNKNYMDIYDYKYDSK